MTSDRSFRVSGDDMDSASLSSYHKRNRLPQILSQLGIKSSESTANNLSKTDDKPVHRESTIDELVDLCQEYQTIEIPVQNKSSLNTDVASNDLTAPTIADRVLVQTKEDSSPDDEANQVHQKNMSKAAILRQLFFSQIDSNANVENTATNLLRSTTSSTESAKLIEPTINVSTKNAFDPTSSVKATNINKSNEKSN